MWEKRAVLSRSEACAGDAARSGAAADREPSPARSGVDYVETPKDFYPGRLGNTPDFGGACDCCLSSARSIFTLLRAEDGSAVRPGLRLALAAPRGEIKGLRAQRIAILRFDCR